MLALHDRLCRNDEEVIAKVMDGEAVIINLANGMYYSMDAVGGVIWMLIEARYSLGEIIDALVTMYDVPRERIQADVRRLGEELVRERIIRTCAPDATAHEQAVPPPTQPYSAPTLNVYRDMGDLLALDPPMPPLKEVAWKAGGDKS